MKIGSIPLCWISSHIPGSRLSRLILYLLSSSVLIVDYLIYLSICIVGSFKLRSGLEKWITDDDNNKLNKSNTSSKTKQFLAQGISKHNISSSSASVPKLTFSPTNLALKAFLYGGVIASTVVGSIGLFTYKVIIPYTIERDRKRYQQEYYDNQAKELVSEFTSAVSEDKLRG